MGCSLWSHQRVRQDLATKTTTSQSRKWIYPECTVTPPPPQKIYIYISSCVFVIPLCQLPLSCKCIAHSMKMNVSVEDAGEVSQKEKGLLLCSVACCGQASTARARPGFHSALQLPWPEASPSAPSGTFIAESCGETFLGKRSPALYMMELWQVAPALHCSNSLCYPVSQSCVLSKKVRVSAWRRGGGRGPLLRCSISAFGVIST